MIDCVGFWVPGLPGFRGFRVPGSGFQVSEFRVTDFNVFRFSGLPGFQQVSWFLGFLACFLVFPGFRVSGFPGFVGFQHSGFWDNPSKVRKELKHTLYCIYSLERNFEESKTSTRKSLYSFSKVYNFYNFQRFGAKIFPPWQTAWAAVSYHQRTRSRGMSFSHVKLRCRCRMSLVTCSKFFRPCLSRIRPVLSSPKLSGCRLFSSLQKRPNFVAIRLPARHASGGNKGFGALLSENGFLLLGLGLLGGSLAYVSIRRKLFAAVLYFKLCIVSLSSTTLSHFGCFSQITKSPSMYLCTCTF